jgi:hypothetical protein
MPRCGFYTLTYYNRNGKNDLIWRQVGIQFDFLSVHVTVLSGDRVRMTAGRISSYHCCKHQFAPLPRNWVKLLPLYYFTTTILISLNKIETILDTNSKNSGLLLQFPKVNHLMENPESHVLNTFLSTSISKFSPNIIIFTSPLAL